VAIAQKRNLGFTKEQASSHISALLRPFEDGKARIGSQAMPEIELVESGILGDRIFAMVNAESMIAREEKVSQPFEDALQDVIIFRALYRTERRYLGLGCRSY
jgi:hypothetical protein